jgi:predicted nuclease with TOPRIM domain
LKDQLNLYRDKLTKLKDKLDHDIQPLNEIGEREIHQPEVEEILKKMKDLNDEFKTFEDHIKPIDGQSLTLKKEFESLITAEKRKKVIISEGKLNTISQ